MVSRRLVPRLLNPSPRLLNPSPRLLNPGRRFFILHPANREWFLVHSEFAIHGLRHDEVGQEFTEAWRQTKTEFMGLLVSVLDALGRRFTIDPDHAGTVLMGTYELALREALMEGRETDLGLLRETLPKLLLSVTESTAVEERPSRNEGPLRFASWERN